MTADDDVHISLPPAIFVGIVVAAIAGGGGLYGIIGPQMDKATITQCIDNSDTALHISAQHSREIQNLRELIYERTADRYTAQAARDAWADQYRKDEQQDRRLEILERAK